MSGPLAGKAAVVTGAGRGIGRAIAGRLAADGARVLLLARTAETLEGVEAGLRADGWEAHHLAVDLSTLEGCEAAARAARDRLGGVDVLVNNAGATRAGSFPDQPDADWVDGFALKFFGAVRLTRLLWPDLAAARGSVVNVGGGAAYTPQPGFMIGGAVNAALANWSKALSRQGLADDVNVNIVHPGMTQTERLDDLIRQKAAAEGIAVEEARARRVAEAGARRLGTPEDVAAVVAFLVGPEARHVQGVSLLVDGGATPGFH